MRKRSLLIHRLLTKSGKTIAVAESCTGGRLSRLLTTHPGSSRYFLLGVVAYSNNAKEKVLGIPARLIRSYGAVSEPVAIQMAESARRSAGADFGIGITGIAGPSGGSKEKPVGTVYCAVAAKKTVLCKKLALRGNRARIQQAAASACLKLLEGFLR